MELGAGAFLKQLLVSAGSDDQMELAGKGVQRRSNKIEILPGDLAPVGRLAPRVAFPNVASGKIRLAFAMSKCGHELVI